MTDEQIIHWLLEGDVAIQYQTLRDLLGDEKPSLQKRIEKEGWGARFLALRGANGHWGRAYYQPKWTSTHYTLLDIKNLNISKNCAPVKQTLDLVLKTEKGPDGGIKPIGTIQVSDVCINGMALNFMAYFLMPESGLKSIVDFLLSQHMADGGFNCMSNRSGATHSSLHTTLSVLEGIYEYSANGYKYRLKELLTTAEASYEFILLHKLYKSHRTGEIISPQMLRLSYPSRWKYDILRALDYFRLAGVPYDKRMDDAIEVLLKKRGKDGRWSLPSPYPGQTHFEMEKAGRPSRWNTLRALRVLKYYGLN